MQVVYGIHVESIGARLGSDICVDLLCRVLSDVQEDSSVIVDSLLSYYQRKLLDMTCGPPPSQPNSSRLTVYPIQLSATDWEAPATR